MDKMMEIFNNTDYEVFVLGVAQLVDTGFRFSKRVTDEDIENIEGNSFMTKEYMQDIVRVAKEIAETVEPVDFLLFIQNEKIFMGKGE